jgi:hypothetical protein
MGLGMIGAIGGLGAGLTDESKYLAKQDEADAEVTRKKDYEGWLLQQQQQYQIATENRTDARAEQQKDRDFSRLQTEAPARRDIKVEDEKAAARGKSAVAAETVETDAAVTQKLTNAKKTPEEREKEAASAEYYRANAEYTRGAKSDAAEAKKGASYRMSPGDEQEFNALSKQIEKKAEIIDKARGGENGSVWDPAKNPGQKQLQAELAALQLRQRTILQRYRSDSGAASDPLGLRGKNGGAGQDEPPPQPGMIGNFKGDPAQAAALVADIKDPQERANAQAAFDAQMKSSGGKLPAFGTPAPAPAPAPAAPAAAAPAAPVSPTEALGRELDASRGELRALLDGKRPGLAAGMKAREEYAAKVESLRAKVRDQEKRYAAAVGGQQASFATARP